MRVRDAIALVFGPKCPPGYVPPRFVAPPKVFGEAALEKVERDQARIEDAVRKVLREEGLIE